MKSLYVSYHFKTKESSSWGIGCVTIPHRREPKNGTEVNALIAEIMALPMSANFTGLIPIWWNEIGD